MKRPHPSAGSAFDDFGRRYREAEYRREADSARWFYHDKISFDAMYAAAATSESDERDGPIWESDHGRGAAVSREIVERDVDGDRSGPAWLVLWRKKRRELSKKQRAVLDALAVDWRSRPAAKLAHVSQPTVDKCKKNFKVHFAQCFQAWKRDFAF